jgi:tetratricopeptide (TPR) repeat protein
VGDVVAEGLACYVLGITISRQDPHELPDGAVWSDKSFLLRAIGLAGSPLAADGDGSPDNPGVAEDPDWRRRQVIAIEAAGLLVHYHLMGGKPDEARVRLERIRQMIDASGYRFGQGRAALLHADVLVGEGSFARARESNQAALDLYRAIDNRDRASIALNNLAGISIYLGEFAAAYDYASAALDTSRELGVISPHFYHQCSWAAFHAGRYDGAIAFAREGLAASGAVGPYQTAMLYLGLGDGYLGLRQWAEASRAITTARQHADSARSEALTLTTRARYATVLRQQGDPAAAQDEARAISESLQTVPIDAHLEPLRSCLDCYRALATAEPEEARPLLEKAYHMLQHQALQIEDEALRRQFLEGIPVNRGIIQAWM